MVVPRLAPSGSHAGCAKTGSAEAHAAGQAVDPILVFPVGLRALPRGLLGRAGARGRACVKCVASRLLQSSQSVVQRA